MYYGLGAFFLIAIVCVAVGAVALKRRREYGESEGDPGMTDAEFREYEGFDE